MLPTPSKELDLILVYSFKANFNFLLVDFLLIDFSTFPRNRTS